MKVFWRTGAGLAGGEDASGGVVDMTTTAGVADDFAGAVDFAGAGVLGRVRWRCDSQNDKAQCEIDADAVVRAGAQGNEMENGERKW